MTPLTDREIDVLRLIAAGRTDAQIADTLGIATQTAKRVAQELRGKLGATNRAHAVALGYAVGLLTIGDATTGSTS